MSVQAIPTASKRLRILGDEEIDALYGRPRFTPDERQEYFAFSPPELTALDQFHSHPSRLYAMLQLGYFKARQQFFLFSYELTKAANVMNMAAIIQALAQAPVPQPLAL